MKEVIFNNQNLSDEDIQIFENKVKVIIKNSKDELLVCKRNGVIHFIGGKVEKNETCATYYYGIKVCDPDSDFEDTLVPESGMIGDVNTISVYPKKVEGI